MLGRQFCLTRDKRGFELPKIATCFDDNCGKKNGKQQILTYVKIQEHVL